ncbi:hypothetical protein Tco_1312971, partial [Tanacetum coccineum]
WQVRGGRASVQGTVAVRGGRHVSTSYCSDDGWTNQRVTRGTGVCQSESSVEDLVPTPSESADLSDGESKCDVPINDDSPESHFSTFDNPLFDSNDDFSSDDESLSEEEIQKDEFKYFSNPLYDLDDENITNKEILPNQKDFRCLTLPIDSQRSRFLIFDEFSLLDLEESNSGILDCYNRVSLSIPILVVDSDSLTEEMTSFLLPMTRCLRVIEMWTMTQKRASSFSLKY